MRIRLVHTQALLLLSAVLLTLLCMGALNAWNLRNGFSDFLASRDVERLEKFAVSVSARAEAAGGLDALAAKGVDMRMLLQEFGQAQGVVPRPPFPPNFVNPERGGFFGPPPRPIDSIDAFKDRVALYAPDGQSLLGKSLQADDSASIEWPVTVQGKQVAVVRMLKLKPVPDDVEARFLTSQYQSILVISGLLLFSALLIARWVAGRWVRPLIEIQTATAQIAQGAFDIRLSTRRTDEIGDVIGNVNLMAEGLQKLEAARRRWLADISHELRTPLTVLRGDIEALNEGIRPLQPEAIGVLHEEVLRLNRLVDDLHLLAISDLQTLPCLMAGDDAIDMLERLKVRFESRALAAGLSLHVQWPANVIELKVHWDAGRIEQLMANLLENSLRYTHAPGQILVRLEFDEHLIRLVVEDSAPGVSDNHLPLLFEPLYRVDAARSNESGGSGLGLAICQVIAYAHEGHLTAAASGLGGLSLRLELPRMSGVIQTELTGATT
jgi:two-component system sensor histidine kinase BaeS